MLRMASSSVCTAVTESRRRGGSPTAKASSHGAGGWKLQIQALPVDMGSGGPAARLSGGPSAQGEGLSR